MSKFNLTCPRANVTCPRANLTCPQPVCPKPVCPKLPSCKGIREAEEDTEWLGSVEEEEHYVDEKEGAQIHADMAEMVNVSTNFNLPSICLTVF